MEVEGIIADECACNETSGSCGEGVACPHQVCFNCGVCDPPGSGGPSASTPPPTGTYCGDGCCDADEDCDSCPSDCRQKSTGKPTNRYCCGDDILHNSTAGQTPDGVSCHTLGDDDDCPRATSG